MQSNFQNKYDKMRMRQALEIRTAHNSQQQSIVFPQRRRDTSVRRYHKEGIHSSKSSSHLHSNHFHNQNCRAVMKFQTTAA